MYLKEQLSGDLVEIIRLDELFDAYAAELIGRYHHGEELQEPELFSKSALLFPSGEKLPRCWIDPHYRDEELRR